ncbi:MAG: phenylalanine--tRNA ligase subunit beta [Sphingomonadales bacterium]
MKFTLSWLRDHLETDADLDTITDKLTALGLEVEEVENPALELAPFTVAKVIEAVKHPNADKLKLCTVETASGIEQVVCGAPNARTGMTAVFAPVGTTIPGNGMVLKPARIRGVESNGMLCSEMELKLSEEHEGIIELPDDAKVGTPFAELLGLDDPVIEIAITPNRQDCLGVRGIARDLAAAGLGTLKPAADQPVPGGFESATRVHLKFSPDKADACPMFVGRTIRGIKNGSSPEWLRRRLTAIGLRPISALVDITNYLTHDRARPLHVYDLAMVSGDICARMGAEGERLAALDGKTYDVDDSICVIADDARAVALGGVMGGEDSGCTETTTDVFVEAALFDPIRTATTGRKLGIDSDARYRFERGVDPAFTIAGMEVATRMILELCGGEASDIVVAGAPPARDKTLTLRPSRVASLGGVDVPANECRRILESLGFTVEHDGENFRVAAPTWRCDIDGEADLVEEVVRVYGYDRIPSVNMEQAEAVARPILKPLQHRVRTAKRTLAGRGLVEAVTWSFMSSRDWTLFGGGDKTLELINPISSELDVMRPSIVPNLVAAAGRNRDRGFNNVALFEVGPQYGDDTPNGQLTLAAGIRLGATGERHWAGPARAVDAFDAKADALAVLAACGVPVDNAQIVSEAPGWYHPGRSGVIRLGPKAILAYFGEIHPATLMKMDIAGPIVGFEIFLDAIVQPRRKSGRTRPRLDAPDLPAVQRDFAFVVAKSVPALDIVRSVKNVDKGLITDVRVFDVYEGPGIDEDQQSVAVTIRLQPRDKTLTDSEIEEIARRIEAAAARKTGAELRR